MLDTSDKVFLIHDGEANEDMDELVDKMLADLKNDQLVYDDGGTDGGEVGGFWGVETLAVTAVGLAAGSVSEAVGARVGSAGTPNVCTEPELKPAASS